MRCCFLILWHRDLNTRVVVLKPWTSSWWLHRLCPWDKWAQAPFCVRNEHSEAPGRCGYRQATLLKVDTEESRHNRTWGRPHKTVSRSELLFYAVIVPARWLACAETPGWDSLASIGRRQRVPVVAACSSDVLLGGSVALFHRWERSQPLPRRSQCPERASDEN